MAALLEQQHQGRASYVHGQAGQHLRRTVDPPPGFRVPPTRIELGRGLESSGPWLEDWASGWTAEEVRFRDVGGLPSERCGLEESITAYEEPPCTVRKEIIAMRVGWFGQSVRLGVWFPEATFGYGVRCDYQWSWGAGWQLTLERTWIS